MSSNSKVVVVKKFRKAFDACVAHDSSLNWVLDTFAGPFLQNRFQQWSDKKDQLMADLGKAYCDYRILFMDDSTAVYDIFKSIPPTAYINEVLVAAENLINGDVK